MNRTVSSNHAGKESFESLLERLTRRTADSQANLQADLDSDFVSGSGTGVASLQGTRRRTLAPVAEVKSGGSKADSMPLSYEKALRLHARRNLDPDTDLRNPEKEVASPDALKAGRDGGIPLEQSHKSHRAGSATARSAGQRTDQGQELVPAGKRTGRRKPEAAGTAAKPAVARRGAAQASVPTVPAPHRTPVPGPKRASAVPRSQKTEESTAAKSQSGSRSVARKDAGKSWKNSGTAAEPETHLTHLPHTAGAKTVAPVVQRVRQRTRKNETQAEELGLQVQQTHLQLEHRHAVVSIRLNDTEIERLRQRAAESGISVSAYMRSCVLDAEHLRAQVKQALAEMRASIQPMSLPAEPMSSAGPVQFPSRLAVLDGIGSGGGGAWSRLLWKSATFLLGPWFFFRHRA